MYCVPIRATCIYNRNNPQYPTKNGANKEKCAPFVIQRAVRELVREHDPPDVLIVPIQDRVNPHKLGPLIVSVTEGLQVRRVWICSPRPRHHTLDLRKATQVLLHSLLHVAAGNSCQLQVKAAANFHPTAAFEKREGGREEKRGRRRREEGRKEGKKNLCAAWLMKSSTSEKGFGKKK